MRNGNTLIIIGSLLILSGTQVYAAVAVPPFRQRAQKADLIVEGVVERQAETEQAYHKRSYTKKSVFKISNVYKGNASEGDVITIFSHMNFLCDTSSRLAEGRRYLLMLKAHDSGFIDANYGRGIWEIVTLGPDEKVVIGHPNVKSDAKSYEEFQRDLKWAISEPPSWPAIPTISAEEAKESALEALSQANVDLKGFQLNKQELLNIGSDIIGVAYKGDPMWFFDWAKPEAQGHSPRPAGTFVFLYVHAHTGKLHPKLSKIALAETEDKKAVPKADIGVVAPLQVPKANTEPITPAQMAQIWDDLASEDTQAAHEAIATLVAAGNQGTQLLGAYVESIRAYADPAQIRRLVWDMSHDESGTSRQDFEALTKLGRLAEQPLRDALTKATSEQNRSRIEQCLAACTKSFSESSQTRRLTRVTWSLQLIGTDHAHQVLKRLGIPEQPLEVWKATGTAEIRPLTGQNHVTANQARDKADLLQAEYSSENRPGPPKDTKAWAKVILEYKDAIEKFPVTEIAAYCRVRLSGFYQYTNDYDRKIRELAQVGRIFEGTNHQAKAYIEIGLTYLQGHHNPAKAIPWFQAVPDILKLPSPEEAATEEEKAQAAALQLRWNTTLSQSLGRCKEELAARAEADNTPWPEAVNGIQCRLRPVKLTVPNGGLPRFRIDAQNIGNHNLWLTEGGNVTEVQVDGQWYTRPKMSLRDPLHWFGPDCQYYDEGMALGKYWRTKETDQPIDLKPGWHTVRAAYIAQSGGVHNTEPFRIESNAVQIEILP